MTGYRFLRNWKQRIAFLNKCKLIWKLCVNGHNDKLIQQINFWLETLEQKKNVANKISTTMFCLVFKIGTTYEKSKIVCTID